MSPVVLVVLLWNSLGTHGRCGDSNGRYCGNSETCCYEADGALGFCCPEERGTCCGGEGERQCCGAGETCVQDCMGGGMRCAALGEEKAGECADTCCDGQCCGQCCGGDHCAPADATCCSFPHDPQAAALPHTHCPSSNPVCCAMHSTSSTSTYTCCPAESSCCAASCEQCCGGCSCCGPDTTCDAATSSCVKKKLLWLVPLLLAAWVVSFLWTTLSLSFRLLKQPKAVFSPFLRYSEIPDAQICLQCGHLPHHSTGQCRDGRLNESISCITCLHGCGRQGCHKNTICGMTYTAKQKMSTRKTSRASYVEDTVSVEVINATCPCRGCRCRLCSPYIICSCRRCNCRHCRTYIADTPRWCLYPLVNGIVIFLFTFFVYNLFGGGKLLGLTVIAFGYACIWAAIIYWLHSSGKAAIFR